MAAGRPIVSSDLPSIREILGDHVNAVLVPPGDVAALTHGIEQLLGDPTLADRLAHAALQDVPKYSWQRRAERLEALLAETIAARPDDLRHAPVARSLPGLPRGACRNRRLARVSADAAGRTTVASPGLPRSAAARRVRGTDEVPGRDAPRRRAARDACLRRCSARRSATTCCARSWRPDPHDLVVDLGCGSGRTLLWNRDWGSTTVGIDISPFFSADARRDVDLLIGDLRRLPFARRRRSPRPSRSTCSSTCRRRRCAACWPKRRACWRRAANCSSTRTCERTRRSPRAALDQRAGASARTLGPDRHAAGTAAQVGSPEPARATFPSSSRSRDAAGFRIAPDPVLHADRRRVRREHPDAHGRARDGASSGRPARGARSAPSESDAQAIREARTAAKARIARAAGDVRDAAGAVATR